MRRLVRRFLVAGLVLIALALPQLAVVTGRFAAWTEWASLVAMFFGVGTVIVASVFLLVIFPRLQAGTTQMTEVAAAVADGDLRRGLSASAVGGFQRQWRIFERMLESLRRLAANLRTAAAENRRTAELLDAGAAGARGAAARVNDGTAQVRASAAAMAGAIRDLTSDGQRLVHMAAGLRTGAEDGARRNVRVREAATAARGQLDEAGRLVAGLETDVRDSTAAVEALAAAAEEIQAFTMLVQQIARQSRLLSLNAGMEAARAGEYGEGFAIVASEVRRLAQSAADAAERTEGLVRAIVQRVADSREKGGRVAATLGAVTAATASGVGTFGTLMLEAEASDRWALSITETAQATDGLARALDRRLTEVAAGLETLARVSAEVGETGVSQLRAADAQSAVAGRLAERAAALAAIAAEFRLPGDEDVTPPVSPATPPVGGAAPARPATPARPSERPQPA